MTSTQREDAKDVVAQAASRVDLTVDYCDGLGFGLVQRIASEVVDELEARGLVIIAEHDPRLRGPWDQVN